MPKNAYGVEDHLLRPEIFWRDHYYEILSQGYQLRTRYHPNWVPSWKTHLKIDEADDGDQVPSPAVMDAEHSVDKRRVILKHLEKEEVDIMAHFQGIEDPANRVVQLLDSFTLSDGATIAAMPYYREFFDPPFAKLSEFLEAMTQLLKGLEFIHGQGYTHRDVSKRNIVMDASKLIYTDWHFVQQTRRPDLSRKIGCTTRSDVSPMQYYFIDFGLSGDTQPTSGQLGQIRSAPEMARPPYDPVKFDIYNFGEMMAEFIDLHPGLKPFQDLADEMRCSEPTQRPSAADAVQKITALASDISEVDLSPEVVPKKSWMCILFEYIRACQNTYIVHSMHALQFLHPSLSEPS